MRLKLSLFPALLFAISAFAPSPPPLARCVGATPCRACKNCSKCDFCHVRPGKCSVCYKGPDASPTR
jgi:hypothetical protein